MGGARAASAGGRHRRALRWALGLVTGFLLLEVTAAVLTGSLALLGDAGHLLTDVVGLGLALGAIEAAARSRTQAGRTFGLYRLEVLAALANAVLLLGLAGFILVEAVDRFRSPPTVAPGPMIVIALSAIVVNLVVLRLLHDGSRASLNLEGAFLEVLADLLSSIGVLVAGIVLLVTGWPYVDPIIAIGIGLWVVPRALRLGAQAVRILLQAAPKDLPPARIHDTLVAVEGVEAVHELHVWSLTSGMEVVSAHLDVTTEADAEEVLHTAATLLDQRHGVEHATLQLDVGGGQAPCRELAW
ncbi:MAG: cation diffusion facilitator family transporter [Nitriliruptoraceae bacterium]